MLLNQFIFLTLHLKALTKDLKHKRHLDSPNRTATPQSQCCQIELIPFKMFYNMNHNQLVMKVY